MRQRALMVGINEFRDRSINKLNGCINDMLDMRKLAKSYFQYTNSDIHCLNDDRAKTKMIKDRLEMLRDWAKPGDKVLFTFSSHGSQIRDRDGDETKDHMDEIICPWDMDWDRELYITDDWMKELCDSFKEGVSFEVLIDACHSGTMLRNGFPRIPGVTIQNRSITPPLSIALRAEGEENIMKPTPRFMTRALKDSEKVLWAGCKSNQTSADAYFNGRYNGAMTYAFCQVVSRAKGVISRKDTIIAMQRMLRRGGYDQIPQLEGEEETLNKNVFSI